MLEKIINMAENTVMVVSFIGITGCGNSDYYPQRFYQDHQREYYSSQENPHRINPDTPEEQEYRPKPKEEISNIQQMAGWCTAAVVSTGVVGGGIYGYKAGDPDAKKFSLTFAAIGGIVMIPSVPMCIYGLAKTSK